MNTRSGPGDRAVGRGMYETAIRREWDAIKRDGEYPCLAVIQRRMPEYNQEILSEIWWELARAGVLT